MIFPLLTKLRGLGWRGRKTEMGLIELYQPGAQKPRIVTVEEAERLESAVDLFQRPTPDEAVV